MRTVISLMLLAPLLLFPSCESMKPKVPAYIGSKNFRLGKMGIRESNVSIDLLYYNPNPFKLDLEKADLDVFIEGKYMGRTNLTSIITIPAKDTFAIPIDMKVDMGNLLGNLMSLGMSEKVELKMKGTALVRKAGIGINLPVDYTGRHSWR